MKKRKHFFTLPELLIAMGILVVLLMLAVRFIAGTQQIYATLDRKNNMYSDARLAMDIVSELLESATFDTFPAAQSSDITFIGYSNMLDNGDKILERPVQISLNSGKIQLQRLNYDGSTVGDPINIIDNVTDLQFYPMTTSEARAIRVTVNILPVCYWDEWSDSNTTAARKSDIVREHGYIFSRVIAYQR